MAARRRVDVFFILYLTAIVGFVVVSKERDRNDQNMMELNAQIVRTFIPPVPLQPERDTVRFYVDADSSGIVAGTPSLFHTRIFVHDIEPDDAISLSVHSVLRDGLLTAPDIVSLGVRTAIGTVHDHVVYFPVSAVFTRTGTYEVNLVARARRVHETTHGRFEYRGIRFDSTLASRQLIAEIERSERTLTIVVEDTSISQPNNMQELLLSVERQDITSAVGYEERNRISVNLGWSAPSVSIIRGGGRLTLVSRTERTAEYIWSDTVTSLPDTVVVEARTHRDAGGKDISQARFTVSGSIPFLSVSRPETVYSGEDIDFDIRVSGLDAADLYNWKLFEEAGQGAMLLKSENRGPRVSYRIPSSYAGKTLVIDARYRDRGYSIYSRRSHVVGSSRLSLQVIEPPTRIELALPDRAPASASFRFAASRYMDARFRGEQPVDRRADVQVEVVNDRGQVLDTDVWMVRKGEFEFSLVDRGVIRRGGERAIVTVRAGEATVRRSIRLY